MENICIVPLIGIPGAGKTTLSEYLVENLRNNFQINVIHINYDILIQKVKAEDQFSNEPYNKIRNEISQTIHHLVDFLHNKAQNVLTNIQKFILSNIKYTLVNNVIIIIDDNSYYRSMRYKYFQICRCSEISFYQIFLKISLPLAKNRNSIRCENSRISEEVIERMLIRLEVPENKNYWEKNSITINSDKGFSYDTLIEIANHTRNSFLYPIKNTIYPKIVIEQSFLHKVDLLIRKCINNIITNSLQNDNFLKDIKSGIIHITEETAQELIDNNMK
ncbi:L-seryl-tRNA(Sec) kinase [Ctenocephalides felis]|uniref:L-seryl-tRNA(Sec) kinase n=1 Tax=Ctenocephalides felis TaxID=7515 RepID=UPI000E6E36DC|nr:L-seryl-tRNA(Sec) kinase [Ctenocephalides felis]